MIAHAPSPWSRLLNDRRLRIALACILAALLWLELVSFPAPPPTSLDASWSEVLVYAAGHDWQFGRDIVFTYGPLGYLCSVYHLGAMAAGSRLAWEIAGKLVVAAGLVMATRRLPIGYQTLFILACIGCCWSLGTSFYMVVCVVAVVEVLLREEEPVVNQVICVFILAFLSELKFTGLVLTGFGVCTAVAMHLRVGRPRAAAAIGAGFCASFLFWWICAGQNLENIAPYVASSIEITRGYANAMGSDESLPVFLTGVAMELATAAFVVGIAIRKGKRTRSMAVAAFLAFNAFTWWKYGFTRADTHTDAPFLATFLLAIFLPAALAPERRWHWFWVAGLLGLFGFARNEPAVFAATVPISYDRIKFNAASLSRFWGLPGQWRAELAAAGDAGYLPAINEAVKSGSVDLFNCDQGVVLINGLNYAPRPVFQSYSAYTPALARKNLDFYRSAAAPAFVLWRQEVIDGRFPTLDDAPLIPELPRAYQAQFTEGNYLLLRKVRDLPPEPQRRRLIEEKSVSWHQGVRVPASSGPVWLQATFALNAAGKLRAWAYKPPQVTMKVVAADGVSSSWRILPEVASDGFLLDPFIQTTADFGTFSRTGGGAHIREISFEAPGFQGRFWGSGVTLRFWSLPDFTAGSAH